MTKVPVKMVERVLRSPVKTLINATVRIHSQARIVRMSSVSIIIKFTFEILYYRVQYCLWFTGVEGGDTSVTDL